MRRTTAKSSIPAGNPIANALVVIAGVLAIGASIVLGFFAFIALSAIILVTAAIIGIRVWWFKRRHGMENGGQRPPGQTATGGVIEGEYRVVHKDSDEA